MDNRSGQGRHPGRRAARMQFAFAAIIFLPGSYNSTSPLPHVQEQRAPEMRIHSVLNTADTHCSVATRPSAGWHRSLAEAIRDADELVDLPDGSLAAPPPPSPATNPTPKPFRLHKVRRRR